MKTINRNSVFAVALFLFLWMVQTASAFYSPNLQRWVNRDPILEAGGLNLFAYVANRAPNRIDSLGLMIAGDGDVSTGDGGCPGTPKDKDDNCYQYACGKTGRNSDIPGASAGKRIDGPGCDRQDCSQVMGAAKADGLEDVPSDNKCPPGTHKVGVLAGNGNTRDVHFFRESKNGKSWCHKFRGKDPSNRDGSNGNGKEITDPKKDDIFDFGKDGSFKFCGFLCAKD